VIHLFHKWHNNGVVDYIQPKRGPFDPKTVNQRTQRRWDFVCVKCGIHKTKKYYLPTDIAGCVD